MAIFMLPSPQHGKITASRPPQGRPLLGSIRQAPSRPVMRIPDLPLAQSRPVQRSADPWGDEREGYSQATETAYTPIHVNRGSTESIFVRRAEQLGSVIAGGGIVWTAYEIAHHSAEIVRLALFPPGPLEVLGFGVLVWLVAKWCRHGI